MRIVAIIEATLEPSSKSALGGFYFTALIHDPADEGRMRREAQRRCKKAGVSQRIIDVVLSDHRKATFVDQLRYVLTQTRLINSTFLGATWYPLEAEPT